MATPFSMPFEPNWRGFIDCITTTHKPDRVYNIELFLDAEVNDWVAREFDLLKGLDEDDPSFPLAKAMRIQRFLGYDYVVCGVDDNMIDFTHVLADDTADLSRSGGRAYMEEHKGPITTWAEFDAFPWPDADKMTFRAMEWYHEHLPEGMCIIGGQTGHFCEWLTWLMGYESLCYALYDQRDLVQAIYDRLLSYFDAITQKIVAWDRVHAVWGSDDMGFISGTLISPNDMRAFVLPGHKRCAEISHAAGKPYLLHSCGNLREIMPDLLDDVRIDGKHSYEDVISPVTEVHAQYGDRMACLGGIDMDFICRADEAAVRARVRQTLEACQPTGRYCLGTGNTVANYVPVQNYLAMLDEGRRWRG
ncbi:MAG: uroporphyrinogen decarboxylase family protein [Anaerolineae bacterium]|jgi:uroporphyrinogen decarboxylase|nr:hypothetical protein [Chloroflexota bacterium]